MSRGLFVVLESGDGCGKTVLLERLTQACTELASEVVATHEPGGSSIGTDLRSLVTKNRIHDLTPTTEILLFSAERSQHVSEVIQPGLSRGALVLSSRYFYATLAYQGYARGVDLHFIRHMSEIAVQGVYPDLVLLLDLPVEQAEERIEGRRKLGVSKDRFESKPRDYHEKVRRGYLELAKAEPDRFTVIDAAKTKDEVFSEAFHAVKRAWEGRNTGI